MLSEGRWARVLMVVGSSFRFLLLRAAEFCFGRIRVRQTFTSAEARRISFRFLTLAVGRSESAQRAVRSRHHGASERADDGTGDSDLVDDLVAGTRRSRLGRCSNAAPAARTSRCATRVSRQPEVKTHLLSSHLAFAAVSCDSPSLHPYFACVCFRSEQSTLPDTYLRKLIEERRKVWHRSWPNVCDHTAGRVLGRSIEGERKAVSVYAFCVECGWAGGKKVPKGLLTSSAVERIPVLRDRNSPSPYAPPAPPASTPSGALQLPPPPPVTYPPRRQFPPRGRRRSGELTANGFKSDNEERIFAALSLLDIEFEYEPDRLHLRHPVTDEIFEYIPDFKITNPGDLLPDYIEVKDNSIVNSIAIELGQPPSDVHWSPRRYGPGTPLPPSAAGSPAMQQDRAHKAFVLAIQERLVVWLMGGGVNMAPPVVAFGPNGEACSQRASVVAGVPPEGGWEDHPVASFVRLG